MRADRQNRRFLRVPIAVEFRVRDADDALGGDIQFDCIDLSAGGAFLRSDYLLEQGDKLEVSFELPDRKERVTVQARVAWVAKTSTIKGEAGMGIEFVDMSEAERNAVAAFVRLQVSEQIP